MLLYRIHEISIIVDETHTSLPTRPHKRQIAGQGETHIHTHTSLPTRPHKKTDRRSGRSTHTHTSLPTRPHKRQIAGQGETHIHTHTSLPIRLHKRQIAGQGKTHIHTHPCLPDHTKGRSPVREIYTYIFYCCMHAYTSIYLRAPCTVVAREYAAARSPAREYACAFCVVAWEFCVTSYPECNACPPR